MKILTLIFIALITLTLTLNADGINPYSDDTYTTKGGPYSR